MQCSVSKASELQNTEYYLDNEAFRYLCARAHGMRFSERERQKYKESYTSAQIETKRLINYIAGLPAHKVLETVTLNEARQIITRLSGPIAYVSHSIEQNLAKIEDRKNRIANIDRASNDYAKELMVDRVSGEHSLKSNFFRKRRASVPLHGVWGGGRI